MAIPKEQRRVPPSDRRPPLRQLELLRDLQTAFNPLLPEKEAAVTLYPENLRSRIDAICNWMQRDLNTGVYKAGFAPDQETYDRNVIPVFAASTNLRSCSLTAAARMCSVQS
jgi:glutathionyl-hydroquinone reductase